MSFKKDVMTVAAVCALILGGAYMLPDMDVPAGTVVPVPTVTPVKPIPHPHHHVKADREDSPIDNNMDARG